MTGIGRAVDPTRRGSAIAMGCALCVVFVSMAFGHATVAQAASGRPSGGGSCGAYAYLGTFPSGPSLTQVQGGASVRCSVPVATQGDVTSGDPVTNVYHPDGQACIQHQNVPIRFNVVADDYHAYFWVDGASVVDPTTWVLYVPTVPDGTGRRIVYEYILQVDAPTLTWHFGDGESRPGSGVGSAYPGGTPSVMHNYRTISQRGCHVDGGACDAGGTKYEITADVNYTVHASLVWFDGVTEHTAALPDAMQELTVTVHPTPEDLFVGQVEGVPVG